jgi:hypothetical protein
MITEASTSIKRLSSGLEDWFVIARSGVPKQSMSRYAAPMDCFAEPVIGRRFAPTRWLAMTLKKAPEHPMAVTVFIRYQLDPFKRTMFEEYAGRWLTIIPRCGGDLVGYWMPHEGTNNIAFALISFENLAAYENYRARLRADREAMANFDFAEANKLILAEERTFLRKVTL